MDESIDMLNAKLFYKFLETYYIQKAEKNENKYHINIEKGKPNYNIYIELNGNKRKYYYFIYTEYDSDKLSGEDRSYTNKAVLLNLIKRLNKDIDNKNNEHEIITLLEESDVMELLESKDLGKIDLNISLLGKKLVEDIIMRNRILYINTLSLVYTIEELYSQLALVTSEDRINYNKNNIDLFIKKTNEKEVSLVLGAGVSVDTGALEWDDLIALFLDDPEVSRYIHNKELVYKQVGKSNLIQAQLARDILDFSADYKYYNILMKGLYPGNNGRISFSENSRIIEITNNKEDYILYHIARFMSENKGKNNFRVLTYNYDNYLELFIDNILEEEYRFSYKSLYSLDTKATRSTSVYHVHGFLPYKKNETNIKQNHMKSVILTEQDYNDLYNDPYRWEIATQLLTYRENTCLFIGSSLTDPNIRRLLNITKNSDKKNNYSMHYVLMHKPEDITSIDYAIIEKHFYKIGVIILWTDDYGIEVLSRMY